MNVRRFRSLVLAGACFLWAAAVVGVVLGRFTPVPTVGIVGQIVTIGAVVGTIVGTGLLIRTGYTQLAA